jgi:trehalose synthase
MRLSMPHSIEQVRLPPRDLSPLRTLDPENYAAAEDALRRTADSLRGRAVWHFNFSRGDGVAEILRSLIGYSRAGGIDANWIVGSPRGYEPLLRQFYNRLYGTAGDGKPLDESAREGLERLAEEMAPHLLETVRPGDVVYLHDAPAAGLIGHVKQAGAAAIWRCHIGSEDDNGYASAAQELLMPMVEQADAVIFTKEDYVWPGLHGPQVAIIQPSLDPFTPKNRPLSIVTVAAILSHIGLTAGPAGTASFMQMDGSRRRVAGIASVHQSRPLPPDAKQVTQVSGWERLKDPAGLVEAFSGVRDRQAHLIVAGPEIAAGGTSEEAEALDDAIAARRSLARDTRDRIHLIELPMSIPEENGLMVNALQRSADVIVHKSFRESFGLSVMEAMWKEKPVVASAVGGIRDQITPGENGMLVDPVNLDEAAAAIDRLLADEGLRARLGIAAGASIRSTSLPTTHLAEYLELLRAVAGSAPR